MGTCCASESTNITNSPGPLASTCCTDDGTVSAPPSGPVSINQNRPIGYTKYRSDEENNGPIALKPKKEVLKELDPPTSSGPKDEIEQFEQSLPFNRIEINELITRADNAAKKQKKVTGDERSFTLATLVEQLDSRSCKAALTDPESTLARLLLNPRFHEEDGIPDEQVDIVMFKCFGLLHCQGNAKSKAIALYDILTDCSPENHEVISAEDIGIKTNLKRLATLATKDIFKLAHELGSNVPDYYSDEDCNTMMNEEYLEALFRNGYIDDVF